jgi:hypothetical protein
MATYKIFMNVYRNPERRRLDGNSLCLKVKSDPKSLQGAIDDMRLRIEKRKAHRLSVFSAVIPTNVRNNDDPKGTKPVDAAENLTTSGNGSNSVLNM